MSKSSQRVEGLTKALEQLEQLFGGPIGSPTGSPDDLRQAIQRVDELAAVLTPADPAELRHFLERRSYIKALDFLRGTAPQEPMV